MQEATATLEWKCHVNCPRCRNVIQIPAIKPAELFIQSDGEKAVADTWVFNEHCLNCNTDFKVTAINIKEA